MDRPDIVIAMAVLLVACGAASVGVAAAMGEVDVSLVLIFPVLSGSGPLFAVGAIGLFLGMLLAFLGFSMRSVRRMALVEASAPTEEGEDRPREEGPSGPSMFGVPGGGSSFGGVVFVGPIPIVFGSNPRMNRLMLVAAVVMALLFFTFLIGAMR